MADRKLRVLFVDDEPGILKMVGKRLEIAGFEVVTAVDGEDALAKGFAVQPDLVVLDLMLPKISGLKVCPQLKQDPRTAQIPVIIFTGKDQDVDQGLWYTFLNGRPNQITEHALPVEFKIGVRNIGFFAQDQWTIKRLTLNLGARFDSFRSWAPAGTRQAGRFTTGFNYDRVDNVPNFKDVTPRIGAAYDLFGDGKTAIKGAIGRYVGGLGTELAEANHPALTVVLSATRTWNDANSNFVPDCDLKAIAANGECGALSNSLFGQNFRNSFYADEALTGWGSRAYSWQGSLSVQHQLSPRVAVNVGYFRTQYANFVSTDNELVAAGDYDPFCVTAPVDARLPGGGGNQQCGLYDVSRARFGQVRNLIRPAEDFGKQVETFNGVDVGLNARFGGGGFVTGGVSTGKQVTDNCFVVDSPQQAREGFCRTSPPWSAGTQFKVNGSYPLPWDVEASFALQNLAGVAVAANWAAPNASIAPSLGRSLSSCPLTGTCAATATVALIAIAPPPPAATAPPGPPPSRS